MILSLNKENMNYPSNAIKTLPWGFNIIEGDDHTPKPDKVYYWGYEDSWLELDPPYGNPMLKGKLYAVPVQVPEGYELVNAGESISSSYKFNSKRNIGEPGWKHGWVPVGDEKDPVKKDDIGYYARPIKAPEGYELVREGETVRRGPCMSRSVKPGSKWEPDSAFNDFPSIKTHQRYFANKKKAGNVFKCSCGMYEIEIPKCPACGSQTNVCNVGSCGIKRQVICSNSDCGICGPVMVTEYLAIVEFKKLSYTK